jgi:hypothetical protein
MTVIRSALVVPIEFAPETERCPKIYGTTLTLMGKYHAKTIQLGIVVGAICFTLR